MAELTFNALASLVVKRSGGEVTAVEAAAPVRGRPLRTVVFSRDEDPEACAFLARIAGVAMGAEPPNPRAAMEAGDVEVELDDASIARLADAGILVPEELVPGTPRFRCDVDDDLPAEATAEPLHVSESLRYRDVIGAPDEARAPKRVVLAKPAGEANPFDDRCAWAFVDQPDAPVASAISVPERDRPLFRALRPGEREPPGLDASRRAALVHAGILQGRAEGERRAAAWALAKREQAAAFASDRHVVLPGLVHPVQLAALRRYYRALVADGWVRFGDTQEPNRYRDHDEPLARFFHHRLAAHVSELAGEPVRPSYAYFVSYQTGAKLAAHRDRAQCAFSISLLLDYTPEPEGPSPWPLWLEGRAIALGLGDALLYRGTELRHWRDPLPAGHASSSLLLHYVPAGFAGKLS
jgi:hypothetical protein